MTARYNIPENGNIWTEGIDRLDFRRIDSDITVDVTIIGGGITGVLAAYLLTRAGMRVALLEKKRIGDGATRYTTAFITQSIDTDYGDIIDMYGKRKAKLIVDSHAQAINLIERIVHTEKIECAFTRVSNYSYANTAKDLKSLEEEYTTGKELGLAMQISKVKNDLGFKNAGYLELSDQAKFHPLLFLTNVVRSAHVGGAQIFEYSPVIRLNEGERGVTIHTRQAKIESSWAILSTYEPFNKPLSLFFKKAFYTTYVYEIEIEKNRIPEGIYEDPMDPYHYFRIDSGETYDRMIVGGEDHRSDIKVNPEKNFKALKEYVDILLRGTSYTIRRRWKGPILEPVDGLPYIGPLSEESRILYTMAFSGNGMTYSAISAMLLSDIIEGKHSSWLEVYRADRIPTIISLLKKARDYGEEFFMGAVRNTLKYRA